MSGLHLKGARENGTWDLRMGPTTAMRMEHGTYEWDLGLRCEWDMGLRCEWDCDATRAFLGHEIGIVISVCREHGQSTPIVRFAFCFSIILASAGYLLLRPRWSSQCRSSRTVALCSSEGERESDLSSTFSRCGVNCYANSAPRAILRSA